MVSNSNHYTFRMAMSDEERIWINELSLKMRIAMTSMVIGCLEDKSKELGIPLPKERLNRTPHNTSRENRERLVRELKEELLKKKWLEN